MDLEGKVAIVTGATGGIGFSISKKLIEKGVAAIAIVDMSDNCQQIADQLNEIAEQQVATPFQGDVTNGKFRETVFSAMRTRFGQPRICVPAAGILRDAMAVKLRRQTADTEAPHEPVADIYPEALFRQVLEVNLLHPSYWAMQMISGIIEERAARNLGPWQPDETLQGSIVLIGSVSSRGNRGQVSYSAAKSGLNAVAATLNCRRPLSRHSNQNYPPGLCRNGNDRRHA